MPRKTLQEQMVEDESWFQKQGREKLDQIFDRILDKNREELFEEPIDRKHPDRPTYFQRLCHCLRYHWEKAQQMEPRCSASKIVKAIYQKYKTRNVFDDVVLAVAVVLMEMKSRSVFRPLYDKTFDSVANTTLPTHYEKKKVNHDDCREHVFDELTGGLSDKQEQKLNVILAGMEIDTLELLNVITGKIMDKPKMEEMLDRILIGMEPDKCDLVKTMISSFKKLGKSEQEDVLDTILIDLESDKRELVKNAMFAEQLKSSKLDLVIHWKPILLNSDKKSTCLNPAKLNQVKNGRLIDYGGEGNFIRWLRKAIYRRIASYYRIKHDPMTPDLPSQGKSPFQQATVHDDAAKLRRVMDQCLTPHERNMFVYHHAHDMTLDEICEMNRHLGIQPTDKGNLSRLLKVIREKIKIHWGNY